MKTNKKNYYVFSAVVERNELILIAYTARNHLTGSLSSKSDCEDKPRFVIDRVPWLKSTLKSLGLEYFHNPFEMRNKVEAVFV